MIETTAGLLQVITAAVTPVVMVSAGAVLTLGIANKHQNMSDRVRALTAELRRDDVAPERRASVTRQMLLFRKRIRCTALGHRALYGSMAMFLIMVLFLIFASSPDTHSRIALALFSAGVALMLAGVVCEFIELRWAGQTIEEEWR